MAAILGGERTGRMTITQATMRHLLDSIATRLDEARNEISADMSCCPDDYDACHICLLDQTCVGPAAGSVNQRGPSLVM